jgi:hypothetical protein
MMAQRGSTLSLTWALDIGGWSTLRLGRFTTRTHFTLGWFGPRTGLDGCRKFRHTPGFDSGTAQPVGSRYQI